MPIHKVLVVDDSKTELMFISDLLQKNGFEVATADGGDQAMQCLAAQTPDLILMDVVMPGKNGLVYACLNRCGAYWLQLIYYKASVRHHCQKAIFATHCCRVLQPLPHR